MSVIGIDLGNLSVLIGQAAKGGVDVILNDASNRQTSTCVSIQGKQRFLGDAAAAMVSYIYYLYLIASLKQYESFLLYT